MNVSSLVHDIILATYLVNFFFPENRSVLEKKHCVCDLESTETMKCSNDDLTDLGQNISWYNGNTGVKIKSGGRIGHTGLP